MIVDLAIFLITKPSGEKCWSISDPKLEGDLFARNFGVNKGDVLVDVLKKKNRELEISSLDFLDQDTPRLEAALHGTT